MDYDAIYDEFLEADFQGSFTDFLINRYEPIHERLSMLERRVDELNTWRHTPQGQTWPPQVTLSDPGGLASWYNYRPSWETYPDSTSGSEPYGSLPSRSEP